MVLAGKRSDASTPSETSQKQKERLGKRHLEARKKEHNDEQREEEASGMAWGRKRSDPSTPSEESPEEKEKEKERLADQIAANTMGSQGNVSEGSRDDMPGGVNYGHPDPVG